MTNAHIQMLVSTGATGELQNVQVSPLPLRVNLGAAQAAINKIASYKVGDSRQVLLEIEEMVRRSQYNEQDFTAMAAMLGQVVAGNGTTDSKDFACRQLWFIGTAAEVPVLAQALKDPALSDMARYALQNMACGEVDPALIAALDRTPATVQIGCINSLAARKSPGAADAIKPLRKSKDKDVAAAAKHALDRLEGKTI